MITNTSKKTYLSQILTLCFLSLFLFACEKKEKSKVVDNERDTIQKTLKDTLQKMNNEPNRELGFDSIESLEDTLAKYTESKELKILDCVESVGCYFEIRIGNFLQNGKRNAVVIIEKTGQLLLYNLENGVWKRIFELENSFVCGYDMGQEATKFEDMNGDNKADILSIARINTSGIVLYDLYLYQSKQKTWERIPFFDQEIPNPKFNHKNNLLYSYSFGGNYAPQTRAFYKWKGNEFILHKEVTQQFIENGKSDSYYHIKHYISKRGERVIEREYKSKDSQIDDLLFTLEEYEKIK